MNRDLFSAILAMDSYNRDYGVGVQFTGASLGSADIISRESLGLDSDVYEDWIAAGFYVIAYDVSGVKDADDNSLFGTDATVVSYRGTDQNGFSGGEQLGGSDAYYGYELAIGNYAAPQASLARDFYLDVAGVDEGNSPFDAGITLTGHSLGGSLAGHVAGNDNELLRRRLAA